jgi:hypothetical protein
MELTISDHCKGLKRVTIIDSDLSLRLNGQQFLSLSHFDMAVGYQDMAMGYLVENCLQLTHLRLNPRVNRRNVTIVGNFFHLASSSLVSLDLSGCTNLMDSSLDKIVERCPFLKELNLSHCAALTFDSLYGINKLNLRVLKLKSLKQISDFSLEPLFRGMILLEEIDLSSNQFWLRVEALRAIIVNCPYLEILNLSGCSQSLSSPFTDADLLSPIPLFCHLLESFISLKVNSIIRRTLNGY